MIYVIVQSASFIMYLLGLSIFIFKHPGVQGQIKKTLQLYCIPMMIRPVLSFVIMQDPGLDYLYGLQMIVFKFALFIMLCTLFKMKKIQILINSQNECSETVFRKYRNFMRNARIFLVFFFMDLNIQVGLIIWEAIFMSR